MTDTNVRVRTLGQRNTTIVTLWHLAKALGVKLHMFFEEDRPRQRAR
jgi:hypothetical protein